MNILLLNGSPRLNGNTARMSEAFTMGAESVGHTVNRIDICRRKISGCLACEYCHNKGNGECVQKDGMQEVYDGLKNADMLVLASPIYYHGLSGQLKCAIDRLYAIGKPEFLLRLKKVAMILSSGDPDMYTGAKFSYDGDFVDFLHLEGMGIFTSAGDITEEKLEELHTFGKGLI